MRKKNSSSQTTNSNHNQSNQELICNQLNNAGSTIFSEPSTMDTLNSINNSMNNFSTTNSSCDNLKSLDNTELNKTSIGQPVIMSSILKSALIGERTYPITQPIKQDENIVQADTTVMDDNVIDQNIENDPNNSNNRNLNNNDKKMTKEEIDELIKQLIQVDDYTNCGRFLNPKSEQVTDKLDQDGKLIQYVQKENSEDTNELIDNHELTNKTELNKSSMNTILEDLNELIQDNENELNELNDEDDDDKDDEDEMFSIIVDNQLSLNEKLCSIGDSIVFRLVQWTKKLPFYSKLPVYSITMVSYLVDDSFRFVFGLIEFTNTLSTLYQFFLSVTHS